MLKNYENINIKTIYRLWFSFFDPLLRGWHLKNLIKKNELVIISKQNTGGSSQYFSFMNQDQLKETFDKVFKKTT